MRAEGSVGLLGEKNLEAKYQKTAIRIIPVIVCPKPPCCCCCLPCGRWPPSTAAVVGGAIVGESIPLRCGASERESGGWWNRSNMPKEREGSNLRRYFGEKNIWKTDCEERRCSGGPFYKWVNTRASIFFSNTDANCNLIINSTSQRDGHWLHCSSDTTSVKLSAPADVVYKRSFLVTLLFQLQLQKYYKLLINLIIFK